jgi:hypothetical protein
MSEERPLAFFVFDNGPTLVVTTFGANGVGRNGRATLRAIADLTLLDVVVGASFASSAVGMFSFGDSHG